MLASNILLIYTDQQSSRLTYIINTLFQGEATITSNLIYFNTFTGQRINYSSTEITGVTCHIYPHGILIENDIKPQKINIFEWKNKPAFFQTDGSIPFDLFAAAFYLITRYEEWLPHETDELSRYKPEQSLAYQNDFLQFPLINFWLSKLKEELNMEIKYQFSFRPSFDIDIAYSYLHHSSIRNILGYFKDLLNFKFTQLAERLQVLAGVQRDPYDIYDWLHLLHESLELKPLYFFLVASNRNSLHKNISPGTVAMQALMIAHSKKYTVGLHPSVVQKNTEQTLQKEKKLLENIIEQPVKHSRQHYIHLKFPETYKALVDSGIEADYSMGYPQINGFRASYTKPFNWFNLATNLPTSLMVYPFCYMDATAIFHEKKTVLEAAKILDEFYSLHQQYGGVFIPIFHNNFLTKQPAFIDWRNLYADFLLKHCTR
ncbi:DUF7033 domain-containing protein [Sediminibacterium sp.]|uniref:DUF7033 domain-containing protein n=1 Tax=Sediminibacterium sp. TaxID=1917865 RepID=UPI003F71A820